MICPKMLRLEKDCGEADKNKQRNNLLNHLKLDKGEGPSHSLKSNPVCRHLEAIFKKGNKPAYKHNAKEPKFWNALIYSKLKMTIPRQGHKAVGDHQQQNCHYSFPHISKFWQR